MARLPVLTICGLVSNPCCRLSGPVLKAVAPGAGPCGSGGRVLATIGLDPAAHLEARLARACISEGPVFRGLVTGHVGPALTDPPVSPIVKRRITAAGCTASDFAAHSLRSGFPTSAAAACVSVWKMREVSRHKSVQVLGGNVRNSDLLKDHAGKEFL